MTLCASRPNCGKTIEEKDRTIEEQAQLIKALQRRSDQ